MEEEGQSYSDRRRVGFHLAILGTVIRLQKNQISQRHRGGQDRLSILRRGCPKSLLPTTADTPLESAIPGVAAGWGDLDGLEWVKRRGLKPFSRL